jgi:predicted O-methyltransferase YrrM
VFFSEIPGWFDFADIYDEAVERFPDGAHFVEIGVWYGRSACYMAQRLKDSGKRIRFSVIDTFDARPDLLEQFQSNLHKAGLADRVEIHRGRSQELALLPELSGPFEFVFVDGSHAFQDVYDDLRLWYPKVRPGGIFAGHDYTDWRYSPDVKAAVDRFTGELGLALEVRVCSWLMRK